MTDFKTSKIVFLIALALSASLSMGSSCSKKRVKGPTPNILLVTVTSMRTDRLSAAAEVRVGTPSMNRMVSNGTLFVDVTAAAPSTRVSHASILTGLYPSQNGLVEEDYGRLSSEADTLAERLQKEGYRTGAVVGSRMVSRIAGFNQGFDYFEDSMFDKFPESKIETKALPKVEANANEVSAKAIAWLKEASAGGKPWFLWIQYNDCAPPYAPPTPFDILAGNDPYSGEVGYVDVNFGLVAEEIKKLGLDGKTLVVITSDHGEGLGAHGEKYHGSFVYRDTTSVFAGFTYPGVVLAGKKLTDSVRSTDIFGTILDYAGVDVEEDYPSRSLRGFLEGKPEARSKGELPPALTESMALNVEFRWHPLYGLRKGEFHLIKGKGIELYDVMHDPGELNNLAGVNPETASKMESELNELLKKNAAGPKVAFGLDGYTDEEREKIKALGKAESRFVGPAQVGANSAGLELSQMPVLVALMEDARNDFANGAYEPALGKFGEIIRLAPDSVVPYYYIGNILAVTGKAEEAIQAIQTFNSWMEYPGWKARGLAEEAVINSGLGKTMEAEKLFKGAIVLDPFYPIVRLNLAVTLMDGDLVDDAERQFKRALEIDDGFAMAYYGLGILYSRDDNRRYGALEMFTKALLISPDFAQAHLSMGMLFATEPRLRDPEKAILHLKRAFELNPQVDGWEQGKELLESLEKKN